MIRPDITHMLDDVEKDVSVLAQALLICDSDMDNSGYSARNKIDEVSQTTARSSLLSLVKDLVSVIVEYNLAVSSSQSADKSLADRLEKILDTNNASFKSQQVPCLLAKRLRICCAVSDSCCSLAAHTTDRWHLHVCSGLSAPSMGRTR